MDGDRPGRRGGRRAEGARGARTSRSRREVHLHWIDPDRDVAQLVDLQQRFGLEAGRAEDGRVATDAVVIVASGDKHWFLTRDDLFEAADDAHVKPREERALTQAIRSVLGAPKKKLCFSVGHGELTLDAQKDERDSLGGVRDLLEKDNYELASVDTTAPGAHDPFDGCAVAVLAGPRAPFSSEEANRLRSWLLQGGTLLAAIGPLRRAGRPGARGRRVSTRCSPPSASRSTTTWCTTSTRALPSPTPTARRSS